MERPDHVDGVNALPVFVGHLIQLGGLHEAGRAGVVNENVDAAKRFSRHIDHAATSGIVGNVGLDGDAFDAGRLDFAGCLLGFVARLGIID